MITKPHEEEWKRHPSTAGEWLTVGDDGPIIAKFWDPARRQLGEAAPDMTRALLASGYSSNGHWHTELCHEIRRDECLSVCAETRAALTKAGVKIP